ncbi:MAG: LCP family protein [Oscillospiraceae bacterium]|nr:LCP family protein [Oscillospiraceae bacterium]
MYQGKFLHEEPPKKKRKRLPVGLRIILWTMCVMVVLAASAYAYLNILLGKIDRSNISGNAALSYAEALGDDTLLTDAADSEEEMAKMQGAYSDTGELVRPEGSETILLVGSDTRSADDIGRSDTMMLATINYDTGKIHLTSLMRTLYVCIPMDTGNTWFALNAAYAWGGIDLLVATIEKNFKVDIDNYAIVDFSAFQQAVDIVGGVDIDLTQAEANYINKEVPGAGLSAGTMHLTGETALWYARIRKIDNDFVRTSRQRTVITALLEKATHSTVAELNEFANKILPLVNTDLTNTEILSHAVSLATMSDFKIDELMLPIENMSGETYEGILYVSGAELYGYDVAENLSRLHAFLNE